MEKDVIRVNVEDLSSLDVLLQNRENAVSIVPCIPLRYVMEGEHIDKGIAGNIVEIVKRKNLEFETLPIPPCVYGTVKQVSGKDGPSFLVDSGLVHYISDDDSKHIQEEMVLIPRCSGCKLRMDKMCSGAYLIHSSAYQKGIDMFQEWIFNEIPKVKNARILDLGCGITPFLEFYGSLVEKNGFSFFLADPSKPCIKSLNKMIPENLKDRIKTFVSMAENISFERDFFDAVIIFAVYAHLFDLGKSLNNIHNVLRKNGIAYIYETYSDNGSSQECQEGLDSKELEGLILMQKEFREHGLSRASEELKRKGFEIIDSFEYRTKSGGCWGIKAGKA